MSLSLKHEKFVTEYLKDYNGKRAGIACGFSPKTAEQQVSRLLRNIKVRRALMARHHRVTERAELSRVRVLEEARRIAFFDIGCLFDEQGNIRPIHELTPEQRAAVVSVEVVIENVKAGDNLTDTIHKVKTADKVKALELLMRHFGLFQDKLEIGLSEDLIARLQEGRQRNARLMKQLPAKTEE